ncbi:MAG: phosphoribosylaminoimidazolesuccinocarboxamide synthase, partial [Proteobacteria bacterium]|nr:phosphoribosylaminoimidazolesuccinocarboxamide synthase [Pseudomonadota bacterium]
FWERTSHEERLSKGEDPESLDKEPIRLALDALGYRGSGAPPVLSGEVIASTTIRYVAAYERITGTRFVPGTYPVEERLLAALNREGLLGSRPRRVQE